ncbi:MAG: DUF3365 domain-containing protein [Nitrospirota bacterium]
MRTRSFNLGIRFSLMIGALLLAFCAFFSAILYAYLKAQVINEAKDKTVIIMTHVKALGTYVKDSLRPRMFDLLSRTTTEDAFVLEAMSTTHVNLQVMKHFARDLPEYVYKRVSDKPLNVQNRADRFHVRMMRYFEGGRDRTSWQGIETIDGKEYLVYVRPILSEKSCLKCHGEPGDAPQPLRAKYGPTGTFGWKDNTIVGVESVAIPLSVALANVKKVALDTFVFGIATLGILFIALFGTFRGLVSKPLHNLSRIFRGIAHGNEPLGKDIPISRHDEIGDVTASFNLLARHLLDAQEKLKKTAEIEKQMIETERLASLGQLAAGVAHEINNPLGGIKLCFNNLISTPMDEEKRRQHIEIVNAGFTRIQMIVKNLLDLSKNAPLSIAPCGIAGIIETVLSLTEYLIGKKGIVLVRELSPDIPPIAADASKLEQVFLNLVINAVQAMEGGGTLTIRAQRAGASCAVAISDTGSGIPEEILPRIFDPFFTTKGMGEGTGLGLTVSKAIVEQHKGEISVTTSAEGTTFTVLLPLQP